MQDRDQRERSTVGIVGVGKMGEPIGRRLLGQGFDVVVPPRSSEAAKRLAMRGARVLLDTDAVIDSCDVLLMLLPRPDQAELVCERVVKRARRSQLVIEHGTIGRSLVVNTGAALARRGVDYLDIPVSGGPDGAASGSLTAMAGGSEDALARSTPVLEAYCSKIRSCGPIGTGQAVKLVNQLLVALNTAASAEAAALGSALGVDPAVLLDVIASSFGASRMVERNFPRIARRDFDGATPVSVILKDLGLIAEEATNAGCILPIGTLVRELFRDAATVGTGDEDMAGIVRLWEAASKEAPR